MDFPVLSSLRIGMSTDGQTVHGSASANTKGAWTELVTSTSQDADELWVGLASSSSSFGWLVDIGVGAAGSEVTIAPDILVAQTGRLMKWFRIPLAVPAGSRIAARGQSTTGSINFQAIVHPVRSGLFAPPPGGKIRALCSNTADSGGLQIDPGAVANTYGSWAEVSSSLPADVAAIWLDLGNIQNTALTAQAPNFRLDIGIGGAGSEVTIFGPIRFGSDAAAQFGPLPSVWWPLSIPAGTRVAARARAALTDATDRKFDLTVHALTI